MWSSRTKISRRTFLSLGGAIVALLAAGSGLIGYLNHYITRIGNYNRESELKLTGNSSNPIFTEYPELRGKIPWIPIGDYPTPVEDLGIHLGLVKGQLLVKRDDLSSQLYGGNKVRKLEHLLAEAILQGKKTLITIGGIGSNHALATAIHGKSLGFRVELCLFDQPVTDYVKDNLRGFVAAGAGLHLCASMSGAYLKARKLHTKLNREGLKPYFIISGGTCGLSNLGHLSAALELKDQIDRNILPYPDMVFVPVGTCGTMAGLLAGFNVTGMPIRITGINVVGTFPVNKFMIRYYAQNVLDHLHEIEPSIPELIVSEDDFDLNSEFLGKGYGEQTLEGLQVVEQVSPKLELETTYTGKTLAACLDYCRKKGEGQTMLFWNSYNSAEFEKAASHQMPMGGGHFNHL